LRRFLDGLYLVSGAIGAIFVLLICVLMIGQSVLRQFNVATGAVNDMVAWSCAAASFFAMAHAFKHGDFVRVTLLLEKLGPVVRRRFEIVCLAIAAVAVGYLAWWANRFTYDSWRFNEVAQGLLPMPIWIPQSSFAIGSILLFIAVVDELVIVLRGRKPTYVAAVEERHARGDFSSDV
jgi:TRAP-type C4-dicarboxylate transport system permease small subunit